MNSAGSILCSWQKLARLRSVPILAPTHVRLKSDLLMPHIALFIPCYIDQFYPQVGMATAELLERLGVTFEFPAEQTCCGQPMATSGCVEEARPLAEKFLRIFKDFDYVVAPSGSCVAMVRHHYDEYFCGRPELEEDLRRLKAKTFELCEFLTDVLQVERLKGTFPYRVSLHK